MLKTLKTILFILTANVAFGTQGKIERINLQKYNIENIIFQKYKIWKFQFYSIIDKLPDFTIEYDSIGRIKSSYSRSKEGTMNFYKQSKDTLKVSRYEFKESNLTRLNELEFFVYNKFGKVERYISILKNTKINYDLLLKSNLNSTEIVEDTLVNLFYDKLFYDSNARIIKIEHYSKSFSNTDLLTFMNFQIESQDFISMDTIIYDKKGRISTKNRVDMEQNRLISEHIKYDTKDRIKSERTTWHGILYDSNSEKTLDIYSELNYIYKRNKTICVKSKGDSGNFSDKQNKEINTTLYDHNGNEKMVINYRTSVKVADTLIFNYEYYQ
jgi:hypothetical protein